MDNFIRRFTSWSRDDHRYESLPLTSNGVPAAEDAKEADFITVELPFRWLQATKPSSRWFWALMPFIISRPLGKTNRTLPKTSSTTYLNGIRGLACWVVFNHHMTMDIYRPWIFKPYGLGAPGENEYFLQMPIVRVLHTGKGMVCLFFALSGFVLSYSSLRKINNSGRHSEKTGDEILTGLSSALLRRGIRLFPPMLVLALITAVVTYYATWGDMDHEAPSIWLNILKFYWACVRVMDPYLWEMERLPEHIPHAWTLAQEYRLSLALFLMLIATCKLTPLARKSVITAVGIWSMYCDRRWDILGFMGGFLVAELRFAPLCQDLSRLFGRRSLEMNRRVYMVVGWIAVLIGLLFCSWPENLGVKNVQPYKFFFQLAPRSWRGNTETELSSSYIWYFGSIGSILILWGMEQLPILQRALSCRALKYLGEISYAFYLVHWLFRQFVGEPLFHHFVRDLKFSRTTSFFAAYTIALVLAVLVGDYFWRVIDENSVKLARFIVNDILGVGAKSTKRIEIPLMQQTAERTGTPNEEEASVLRLD